MMSYLYPEDEVTFDKSGFGPLPDMLESYAEEEANSYFELYFEYPLLSSHERGDYNQVYVNMSDYLIEGNQVTYKPSHSREPHAFRIYKTEKQVERGIILVWARTRTADLRGNPVRRVVSNGAPVSSALRALKLASEETHPFSFTTNIQSNISFEKNQTNVLDALAGEEDSILAITGGQMIRTNNNVYIGINESSKNIVEFRLGKNIEGISYEVDYSNVVTAVIPFYTQTYKLVDDIRDEIVRDSSGKIVKNADGTTKYNRTVGKKRESLDKELIVYGDTVFSQYANDYSTPFYSFVEIRDDREDVGLDKDPLPPFTKTDINNRAVEWFNWEENLGVDEPEVSVKVGVHDISQSSEYSHDINLAKLETLNVFDKALVYVPEVGIDMDMEINYIRYDGVAEKNLEVRLGTTLTSLTETVLSPQQRAFNERVQQLDREITKSLMSSDGKSRVYWMATKPVGQFEIGDLWFDITLDGGIYVWDGYDWVAKLPPEFGKLIEESVNGAIEAAELAMQEAQSAAGKALEDAKADATVKANAIKEQITGEVNTAISTAETAKQTAIDGYNNAVAEAERLVGVQKIAFDKKFDDMEDSVDTFNKSVSDVGAKADEALEKAGANANLLNTHQNAIDTINTVTLPDILSTAGTALANAKSAMDEAKNADGKIADYVTKNGLVNGTAVDSKIDTATGAISRKITAVEGKVDGLKIDGRNYLPLSRGDLKARIGLFNTDWKISDKTIESVINRENHTLNLTLSYDSLSEPIAENEIITFSGFLKVNNGIPEKHPFVDDKLSIYVSSSQTKIEYNQDTGYFKATYPKKGNWLIYANTALVKGDKISIYKPKVEKDNISTDWTPAPEDNYTQEEFKIFESTYDEDVKGIRSSLAALENDKLDGSTYTTFYKNEYEKTAQGVKDAYEKIGKVVDENGNTTDSFAKAVYDQNATRRTESFNEVTKDLVKEATYTSGIDGVSRKITTVEGRLTAIDSSAEGSVVTRLNATEKTAIGNTTTISDIKTKPGEQITGYQTIKERSDLYERVIGKDEAGVKSNVARIVMTDSAFQTEVVDRQNLLTAMAETSASKITQLADNINLKVSKSDLLSQINVQAGNVLIQSGTNKLNVTPETTYIENATIKSAMIDTIDVKKITGIAADFTTMVTKALTANTITSTMINANDAMFEKLFANSMATTKLAAQKAWITDANIASLDAGTIKSGTIDSALIDAQYVVTNGLSANVVKSEHIKATVALVNKIFSEEAYIKALTSKSIFANQIKAIEFSASKITTGELDGSKASITNIDAKNITANGTNFVQSAWNAINSEVSIDGSGIKTQNSSGDFSRIISGELRSFNKDSSSTAILGSGRSQYFDNAGSQFILGNTLHGNEWLNDGTLQVTHNRRFAIGRYNDYDVNNGKFHPYIGIEYPQGKTGDEPHGIVRFYKAVYLQKDIYAGNNAVSGLSKITFHNGGNIESQPKTSNMLIEASNKLIVYASGTNALEIDSGYMYLKRNLSMEGNKITNQSDRRLKTNIVDTPVDSLSAISNWSFKAFDRVNNGTHDDVGLIAQDTSEIVVYDEGNDTYYIDSSKQIMMNSHGIQQLITKVDDEVSQLKAQVASLQEELAILKGE